MTLNDATRSYTSNVIRKSRCSAKYISGKLTREEYQRTIVKVHPEIFHVNICYEISRIQYKYNVLKIDNRLFLKDSHLKSERNCIVYIYMHICVRDTCTHACIYVYV